MKDILTSSKIKIIQTAITMLLFLQISSRDISYCNEGDSLTSSTCFNNIIKLNNYRAGQFEQDKDGNMFLLYSNSINKEKRLFYGLKSDGRNYFERGVQVETQINYSGYSGTRDGSRIIFVTIDVGGNDKQYLFTISAGNPANSLVELYEIKENGISSSSNTITNFLEISRKIYSYHHSLFKLPDQDIYFFGCVEYNTITIIKFDFSSQNLDTSGKIDSTTEDNVFTDEVMSLFLMEENDVLVLFYIAEYDDYIFYSIIFYDTDDLSELNRDQIDPNDCPVPVNAIFLKGLWIKENYAALIYFCDSASEGEDYEGILNITEYNSDYRQFVNNNPIYFEVSEMNIDLLTNEFIKIDYQTLIFISTLEKDASENPLKLYIILFDFNEYLSYQRKREYSFDLGSYYLKKELAAFIYNNFLVLSSSYNPKSTNDDSDLNSLLFFFGYPNGTDESISISGYLNSIDNIGTDVTNNIYKYLKSKMKVENNIFNYEEVDLIKLVSKSDDIQFYGISEDGLSEIPLSDSKFGERHILKQDLNLKETNQDSYFYYQYIVKEVDSSDGKHLRNIQESETSKFYYGRTNKLTFSENSGTECTYESLLNNECVITGTNEEILEKVKTMIGLYQDYSKILSIGVTENTYVEITNDKKDELLEDEGNLAKLDLGECGKKIRETYPEIGDKPLIILKYGVSSDVIYENYIVYEIYNPITFNRIEISELCKNIDIGVYIDTKMSYNVAKSVKSMVDQGYNPFDLNDKFYREICTPYDSPDGTDVLLDDREEYFFSQLNTIVCPDNCKNSAYPLNTKYIKCDCPVEDEVTLNIKHMTGKNLVKSFESTLKNSNWRAMDCYKLVFDKDIFPKNIGSILTLILLIIYIGFFVFFVIQGITPLQNSVAGMMSAEDDKKEEPEKNAQNKEKNPIVISFKNPPKKSNSEKEVNKDKKISGTILDKKENDIQIVSKDDDKKERVSVTDKDLSKINIKKDSDSFHIHISRITYSHLTHS